MTTHRTAAKHGGGSHQSPSLPPGSPITFVRPSLSTLPCQPAHTPQMRASWSAREGREISSNTVVLPALPRSRRPCRSITTDAADSARRPCGTPVRPRPRERCSLQPRRRLPSSISRPRLSRAPSRRIVRPRRGSGLDRARYSSPRRRPRPFSGSALAAAARLASASRARLPSQWRTSPRSRVVLSSRTRPQPESTCRAASPPLTSPPRPPLAPAASFLSRAESAAALRRASVPRTHVPPSSKVPFDFPLDLEPAPHFAFIPPSQVGASRGLSADRTELERSAPARLVGLGSSEPGAGRRRAPRERDSRPCTTSAATSPRPRALCPTRAHVRRPSRQVARPRLRSRRSRAPRPSSRRRTRSPLPRRRPPPRAT